MPTTSAYRVVNQGVSGDTTTDGLQRLPNVVADTPKLVILEFGGNDGLRGLPVASTRANLEQMVTALQKSGAKVVLAGITLPRNYGQEYIHPFEQMYVGLAKQYHLARIPFLLGWRRHRCAVDAARSHSSHRAGQCLSCQDGVPLHQAAALGSSPQSSEVYTTGLCRLSRSCRCIITTRHIFDAGAALNHNGNLKSPPAA